MPQMMPINWIFMFIFTIIFFMIFNMMNYYIFNIKLNFNEPSYNKKVIKNLVWKW